METTTPTPRPTWSPRRWSAAVGAALVLLLTATLGVWYLWPRATAHAPLAAPSTSAAERRTPPPRRPLPPLGLVSVPPPAPLAADAARDGDAHAASGRARAGERDFALADSEALLAASAGATADEHGGGASADSIAGAAVADGDGVIGALIAEGSAAGGGFVAPGAGTIVGSSLRSSGGGGASGGGASGGGASGGGPGGGAPALAGTAAGATGGTPPADDRHEPDTPPANAPEPGTVLLLASGLTALGTSGWRRQRASAR
jgi:hypothetical protein